ncbi:hypothetical protein GCM10011316_16120 [Roseibium aquae]|uniref:ABC-type amino acid transport substrate-binding protein n=1 Tax=Roseibium aquae TaxID=1323746 RepID=A0A916TI28_9HYPH|nr:hypothetical protein [Roseibium aquae]GGB44908.1 hypothetical protein GCM10011316_16120 [Roseibium aquae]
MMRIGVAVVAMMLPFDAIASEKTWRVAAPEWAPYSGPGLPGGGTAVMELQSRLADLGIGLDVSYYPLTRAQRVALAPDYAGYFPAWPWEVRVGFQASEPIATSTLSANTLDGQAQGWWSFEDVFAQARVGVLTPHSYPPQIQDLIEKHSATVSGAIDETHLARLLHARRIDVALTDPFVIRNVFDRLGFEPDALKSTVSMEIPLVLAVKPELARSANMLLETIDLPGPEQFVEICVLDCPSHDKSIRVD